MPANCRRCRRPVPPEVALCLDCRPPLPAAAGGLDPAVAEQAEAEARREIELYRSQIIDDAGPPNTPEQAEKVRWAWARIAKYFGKETP
jgi:hypothetical protein